MSNQSHPLTRCVEALLPILREAIELNIKEAAPNLPESAREWASQQLSEEATVFIRDQVEETAQMAGTLLIRCAYVLSLPLADKEGEALLGRTRLREVAIPIFDQWIESLPVKFRDPGRPPGYIPEEFEMDKAEFILLLKEAYQNSERKTKGEVAQLMGYGKNEDSAVRTLYRWLKKYSYTWKDLQNDGQ